MAKEPQINTFTNLQGVDGEVQKIQSLMVSRLSWLDYSFGLAENYTKQVDGEKYTIPVFFDTNYTDAQDLRPNDQWVDYCFWTYQDSGEVLYGDGVDNMVYRKGKPYITYPVSCIFYMRLPKTGNYKVLKTQRRQEVIEFFDTLTGYAGIVAPTQWIDHDIKAVFDGYDLGELEERWMNLPFYALRVNMDIKFRNYCV